MNILVAEDNPINQKLIELVFKSLGYEIDIAADGNIAVEMVQKKDYNIVFMDIQMPNLDGVDATIKIRELGYDLPIVAMTANTDDDTRAKVNKCGMNDFLAKPIRPDLIKDSIGKWG